MRALPEPVEFDAGIYFLWDGDELLYIGKSRDVLGRKTYQDLVNKNGVFHESPTAKFIPYDAITCLVVQNGWYADQRLDGQLQNLERIYIATYEPPYNIGYINGFT